MTMFRPVKMSKVNILLMSKHVTEITQVLGHRGLIHLVDAVNQSSGKLISNVDLEQTEKTIFNTTARCERLMEGLGVDRQAAIPEKAEDISLEDMNSLISKIYEKYHGYEEELSELLKATGALDKTRSTIAEFPLQEIDLDVLRNLSHFYMVTGKLEQANLSRALLDLNDRALIIQDYEHTGDILVISSNKNKWAVKDDLDKYGFTELQPPGDVTGDVSHVLKQKDGELATLKEKIENCRMNVLRLSEQYGSVLLVIHSQLKGMQAVQQAKKHFGRVATLFCISGWTPDENVAEIRKIVDDVTGGTGLVEITEADNDERVQAGMEEVPVQFGGGRVLKPFQLLISNFGLPKYNELDPSLFVGITFIILFGFMFGDIGQGLTLALAGLWMLKTRRDIPAMLRDVGIMFIGCGAVATVFGFFYGSFFGYENHELLKPLWLSPLKEQDIVKLLLTAVGVGIIFTSVAIIINIINHFIAKKYFDGVFDRFGVLGLLFYWIALGTGILVVKTGSFPVWAGVFIIAPLVLLFFRGPLRKYVFKKQAVQGEREEDETLFNMMLEACVELMETFTGYISGTVSFVRVGAFAISHAALCLAVFSIVKMIQTADFAGGGLVSLIIIVCGNLLVMAFEGMVVMIQGVRLEYYELFGKYFKGGGKAYEPFVIEKDK